MNYEKLIRDGKVAVLYSPGYGAGWFTWAPEYPGRVFDREIAEAILAGDQNLAAQISERKYPNAYTGGARDLTVTWLPEGTIFDIEEYDGNESIHIIGTRSYLTA